MKFDNPLHIYPYKLSCMNSGNLGRFDNCLSGKAVDKFGNYPIGKVPDNFQIHKRFDKFGNCLVDKVSGKFDNYLIGTVSDNLGSFGMEHLHNFGRIFDMYSHNCQDNSDS